MAKAKTKTVLQTPTFKKAVKKLKPSQKKDLDNAIRELMADPFIGQQKKSKGSEQKSKGSE